VVLASTAVLSVLVLNPSSQPLENSESRTTFAYIAEQLGRDIRLWYLLPFAAIYLLWETVRGNRLWGFYLALLVLQTPVCLVLLQAQIATRQWLIPQTLLYGALAGLIVKILGASIRKERHNLQQSLAFGLTSVLIIASLGEATVSQVRYLFKDVYTTDNDGNKFRISDYPINDFNPSVRDMHDWIAANVPEGEKIITTEHYDSQLAFLDGMQHKWTRLQIDCGIGYPDDKCHPSEKIVQAPPQPVVWFYIPKNNCEGLALSLNTLMQQMERSDAKYLLTTQERQILYPVNLGWAPYLESNGAFETVYSSYLPGALTREQSYGLVLLKWSGRNPTPAPTQMDANTVKRLIRCEEATWGEQYAQRIREAFPNGIEITGGTRSGMKATQPAIEKIYGTQ